MASIRPAVRRRRRRYDFHAERVRRRTLSKVVLLGVFLFAGTTMILAAMKLLGR